MQHKRAPRNTTAEVSEHPLGIVADAMALGAEQAIVAQESSGQVSFVASDTLPSDIGGPRARAALEAVGLTFLGPVEGDELFQYVTLPPGWTKKRTGHAMWSKLLDDKGRERASIFYKAAFYDRSAFLSIASRYTCRFDYDRLNTENVAIAEALDGENVIFSTDPIAAQGKPSYELSEPAKATVSAWLDEHYPEWKDPAAYWD